MDDSTVKPSTNAWYGLAVGQRVAYQWRVCTVLGLDRFDSNGCTLQGSGAEDKPFRAVCEYCVQEFMLLYDTARGKWLHTRDGDLTDQRAQAWAFAPGAAQDIVAASDGKIVAVGPLGEPPSDAAAEDAWAAERNANWEQTTPADKLRWFNIMAKRPCPLSKHWQEILALANHFAGEV